jgi:hypothetical protein
LIGNNEGQWSKAAETRGRILIEINEGFQEVETGGRIFN